LIFEKHGDLFIGKFPRLFNDQRLLHGMSTRPGGVSSGNYESLNLSYTPADSAINVANNQNTFFEAFDVEASDVAFPQQIHGTNVQIIEKPGEYVQTDGLITAVPNVILTIQVADCLPVFIYDPHIPAICLIHAGWRGCVNHIVPEAVKMMVENFGSKLQEILVFLGPSIGPCCYEVGVEFKSYFSEKYFLDSYLDMPQIIGDQLLALGVHTKNIQFCNLCTSCNQSYFFSYRRDKGVTGRMLALAGIIEN